MLKIRLGRLTAIVWSLTVVGAVWAGDGDFRFLTQGLPNGSTNAVYSGTLLVANAAGPVTFSISAGALPPGMTLDATTGYITGRPTVVMQAAVTFAANDGVSTITFATTIKINASGGGGNAGTTFATTSLPEGRVGVEYGAALEVINGIGPYILGAANLPAGLSLNGLTGAISGTPAAAGTFYVTFSVTDTGENNNKVLTVMPLLILPAGSEFKFTTTLLDNGQIGTAYHDVWQTTGAPGAVSFSAAGLPPGVSVEAASGVVSGQPEAAGTFLVEMTALSGADVISTNRSLLIVPSATSSFHWVYDGLPAAIINLNYARQPPLQLITGDPGPSAGVMYFATGLPGSIIYNATSGQFSGVADEAGIYPVLFTAIDSNTGAQLTLATDFIVLPPNGGDTNTLPVNLWVKKQTLKKTGQPGKDSWQAQYQFNADRRTGKLFDPATQPLVISLGGLPAVELAPGTLAGKKPKYAWKSPSGTLPAVAVSLDLSAQTLALAAKGVTSSDSLPGTFRNTVTIGQKGFKLDEFFDAKGVFVVTAGYRKTAFVAASAKLLAREAGKDSVAFALLLADPAFDFNSETGPFRFRLFNAGNAVLDKTFAVTGTAATDTKTGKKVFKLKNVKDAAASNTLSKFTYDSKSGKMALFVKNATLTELTGSEAHLSLELAIGDKTYFTGITVFAPKGGMYTQKF